MINELDPAVRTFVDAQPRLLDIAYRTLGRVSDAEDIVQEAWLRWQRTDRAVVRNPTAFLATTTSRLALNFEMSARRRHETYTDPQQMEPADFDTDPERDLERRAAIEQAMLLVLRKLTPMERAACVLRDGFDYPYWRIAELLQIRAAYARQLLVRAHRGLTTRPPQPVDAAAHRRLAHAFVAAAQTGNLSGLEQLLAADVTQAAAG